jgi:soluble cytochrome b562
MKTTRLLVVLAALLSLNAVGAGTASATTVNECQAQLVTLRDSTLASHESFAYQKDVDGLVAKIDAASAKLAAGKTTDAVVKLVDFQTTLNALATAPKPKVDPAVAQALSAEAQGVIVCINEVGTG